MLTDDLVVTRFLEASPEENLKAFPGVLAEAVQKARLGQWIYIVFTHGKDYEWSTAGNNGFGRIGMDPQVLNPLSGDRITQEQLDAAAPRLFLRKAQLVGKCLCYFLDSNIFIVGE